MAHWLQIYLWGLIPGMLLSAMALGLYSFFMDLADGDQPSIAIGIGALCLGTIFWPIIAAVLGALLLFFAADALWPRRDKIPHVVYH